MAISHKIRLMVWCQALADHRSYALFAVFTLVVSGIGILRKESYWPFSRDDNSCLLRIPQFVKEFLRPPVYCEFCSNLTLVVRRRNLTIDDFEKHFAYNALPLIVEDGMQGWGDSRQLNFNTLRKLHDDSGKASSEHCQFFPYQSGFHSLTDVFRRSDEELVSRDAWYIGWQACDQGIVEKLRKFYRKPYFLPKHSEGGRSDWIFIGSPGYGAGLHIDDVGNPSWQAQLTGTKEWTLQPPPECYFRCPAELTFTVKPGEIFVFDSNKWYHSTKVVGNEISMSIGAEYD